MKPNGYVLLLCLIHAGFLPKAIGKSSSRWGDKGGEFIREFIEDTFQGYENDISKQSDKEIQKDTGMPKRSGGKPELLKEESKTSGKDMPKELEYEFPEQADNMVDESESYFTTFDDNNRAEKSENMSGKLDKHHIPSHYCSRFCQRLPPRERLYNCRFLCPPSGDWPGASGRWKRKVFLPDNRLNIRANSVGRFPFDSAVAIRVDGEVICSGIALQTHYFLTAAHCVKPEERKKEIEVGVLFKYGQMHWVKVRKAKMDPIWTKPVKKHYKKQLRQKDYAVLVTDEELNVTPMSIGYVGTDEDGNEILQENKTYMYFSAFDDERRPEQLNMRFCKMEKIRRVRIYSKCDTVQKTAGAGVYVRMRSKKTGNVERKVIAIATGDYDVNPDLEYSVALRITARMFPHICYFVTNSWNQCG